MKIVAIYQPEKSITAQLKDRDTNTFFAPVLFIAVTEDGKLIPCVGGKGNIMRGKSMTDGDVVVSLDENYIEMTVNG